MSLTLLKPITSVKLPRFREAAYQAIKEAILSGQIGPHQPFVEEQLAASLQISRTPVREALAILEHEGLIAPRGGRGLYITALSRQEFVAMFVANETVEPYLVRRAALQATRMQLETLQETIMRARSAEATQDATTFLRASRDFHRLVGEASGNQPLTTFVLRNEERTDMFLLSVGANIATMQMETSTNEHAAILAALVQRDPEAAARLSIYHTQSLRQRFADLFDS
ncbi:MAG: GntR family transcriptional regulator [Roseiflexaceae bacterium]|nr:GntR family transcriptional regulator [Roseiflexaceae bacterium]